MNDLNFDEILINNTEMPCSQCRLSGHNIRTCPQNKNIIEPKEYVSNEKNFPVENDKQELKVNEKIVYDNDYVLKKMDEYKNTKIKNIVKKLRVIAPSLNDEDLIKLYNESISIHQSNIQQKGDFLENDVLALILDDNKINYKKQVVIDKEGIIVGFGDKKKKCYHIIDFVIGNDIKVGSSITNYKVISCKTTCRERWTQDDWTFTFLPKKYILLTISDDYPSSERFRENTERKIMTCIPKKKDDRKYKLNFENLIDELK